MGAELLTMFVLSVWQWRIRGLLTGDDGADFSRGISAWSGYCL